MSKLYIRFFLLLVLLVIIGELAAMKVMGLGDPPLSTTHQEIEYMFKPNQEVVRFGNRVQINNYGMRSEDFPPQKAENEFRLLIFGDSVLNGGNLTDQTDLATEFLKIKLEDFLDLNVVVGNVSAGSWGPGNWLGYARTYGFFDADAVVLLISSHDARDNPTFDPLNPQTHPERKPVSALWEGVTRYLPRYLPELGGHSEDETAPVEDSRELERGLSDLNLFLSKASEEVSCLFVVQFLEQSELLNEPMDGYYFIKELSKNQQIVTESVYEWFKKALKKGEDPFRDNIHINDYGQSVLSKAFYSILTDNNVEECL